MSHSCIAEILSTISNGSRVLTSKLAQSALDPFEMVETLASKQEWNAVLKLNVVSPD